MRSLVGWAKPPATISDRTNALVGGVPTRLPARPYPVIRAHTEGAEEPSEARTCAVHDRPPSTVVPAAPETGTMR